MLGLRKLSLFKIIPARQGDRMPLLAETSSTATLGGLDWGICAGYLLVVFLLGLWVARDQHSNEDYFVGGRTMHWLPIGLSIFAGTFSSLSFVGLPSDAAYEDYHLLLGILFIPFVVTPIVWCLFLPFYFRLGLTSAYEYVERRFNRRLRLIASVLFLLYTIGWMGNLLRAVGLIMQAVLDLSPGQTVLLLVGVGLFATFYTAIGGVKAVVWTDALQAFALGGGMLLVLYLAVDQIDGGWQRMVEIGQAHHKFDMFHTEFDFKESNVYAACAFGFFVYLAGHAVSFGAVQRYVSMPNIAAARRSLLVNGVMVAAVCTVFFLVGSTLFAFYHQTDAAGSLDETIISQSSPADVQNENLFERMESEDTKDQLLSRFLMAELPLPGLMGLLLAGLFAAAMSSIDSGINSMTASVVCDWQGGRQLQLQGSRILCASFGAAAVTTSIVLYFVGGDVFPMIMKIAGAFFGVLLGVFLLGMLTRRANSEGATLGVIAGAAGLGAAFYWEVSEYWFGAFTCLPTLIGGAVASLFFDPPTEAQLRGLVVGKSRES
jgi:SSS family transporter